MKKKNTFLMWPNGPDLELPWGYYWDIENQQVVRNDKEWRGDLVEFWQHQRSPQYQPQEA